ncbi:hypothetical protein OG288_36760 [Streptomyces tauricus]|uniref:Uncharacterized protein n=1 Tax=Streptomyces tauricus TaxID=68274 RepID=A0ABZ1JRV1_9ACTN|nr:hypothetical protein [Streptomyces tauricus]
MTCAPRDVPSNAAADTTVVHTVRTVRADSGRLDALAPSPGRTEQ